MYRLLSVLSMAAFLLALSGTAYANAGIDSMTGSDLPVSGGGTQAMAVGGGQAVPAGDVEFLNRVGVGTPTPQATLDVKGGVKVGYTTTCDASTAGTMRYNPSTSVFEGCNGTKWSGLASAAFGGWTGVESSGTAATDGLLVITSGQNETITGYTSGTQRFTMAGRSKYGQGADSMTMPVKKGETWDIAGANAIWFLPLGD